MADATVRRSQLPYALVLILALLTILAFVAGRRHGDYSDTAIEPPKPSQAKAKTIRPVVSPLPLPQADFAAWRLESVDSTTSNAPARPDSTDRPFVQQLTEQTVTAATLSADGLVLAVATEGDRGAFEITAWNTLDLLRIARIAGRGGRASYVAFPESANEILSFTEPVSSRSSFSGHIAAPYVVATHDLTNFTSEVDHLKPDAPIECVSIGQHGGLIFATWERQLFTLDRSNNKSDLLAEMPFLPVAMHYSPASRLLAVGGLGGQVLVAHLETGTAKLHSAIVPSVARVALNSDGTAALALGADATLYRWSLAGQESDADSPEPLIRDVQAFAVSDRSVLAITLGNGANPEARIVDVSGAEVEQIAIDCHAATIVFCGFLGSEHLLLIDQQGHASIHRRPLTRRGTSAHVPP